MIDTVIYDTKFNGNEWYVIVVSLIGLAAIWYCPGRLSPTQTTYTMLIGIAFGLLFDHTIAVPPFDFYDFGDRSSYEWFDFFSYAMYAPYGYLIVYGYHRLRMYSIMTIPYLLVWSGISIGFEWLGVKAGVFHYKNGYHMGYSWPVYLFLMSIVLGGYQLAFANSRLRKSEKK